MITKNKIHLCIAIIFIFFQTSLANIYYVSTSGDDMYGDGSQGKPWRTLKYAASRVPANQGHTIQLSAGTFIEGGQIQIPAGVNVEGAGKNLTILKAASSFYYNPSSPGYSTDKFLISLSSGSLINGNQTLRRLTVDGDSKQLHGGIYVQYRSNVIIEGVSVQNTNFNGIWLWDVKDSKVRDTDLLNCSWGSTGYCSGALNLGNLERVEIDNLTVDESVGYGVKAIGPGGSNNIVELKIHDSRVSVNPYGLWNNGGAPNIAIELWSVNLVGCEIYDCYVDNTISLVNSNSPPSTGTQTIRVHHNTLDMETRAKGEGYGVELSINDAEVDHNYFIRGRYGIAHWDNFVQNWNIHHNVFYGLGGVYPGDMVRSQKSGLHNVNFYNNTIEFTGDRTMNVVGIYAGTSENVNLANNLFINNNTGYSYYPNSLVHLENGAVLNNLSVKNNLFDRLPVGNVTGIYSGNLTGDPKISKSGVRPNPYYMPTSGSPLIDAALNLASGLLDPIIGAAPDIGAYEFSAASANQLPEISISSPANNSTFTAGSSTVIIANASDTDGTITKVEFFSGSNKLGEDLTSPYSFSWTNLSAGSYALTAKATDNVGATATSPIVSVTVANRPLPSPWLNADIGSVAAAGSASYSNAIFTLSASGADIWDTADEFQFVYQTLNGDGSIVAKVNSLTNTNEWAKAGVMIRESLNANAAHATSVVTASKGVSFQRRPAAGNISFHTTLAGFAAPEWLKIERSGNTFTSSYSSDGIAWTVIGTEIIPMGPKVYIGLCSTSHADGVITAASFSDVTVTGPLPSPWQNLDIGSVGAAGSASFNNGSFAVKGSGADIWHTADAFQFVYQRLSGDGSIVAKVNSLVNTDAWAKAGVMIRESLAAYSKHATSVITPARGVSFQNRKTTGGTSYHKTLSGYTAPVWLKIQRSGDTFTSSYSVDGVNWAVIGTEVISMTSDVYIGLCVTSHVEGVIASASFSNVTITGALPAPWKHSDIGTVGAAGGSTYNNGLFTIKGSGADIWHTADEFQFVYQALSGDGNIVAKVNSLENTNEWAKAGVMIRESLAADSKHAMSVITPSSGVSFQNRTITSDSSYHTTLAGHTAPIWLKIERAGDTFTSSYSADGAEWTVIGAKVIAMTGDVYIGLCITSHADGVITAASFSDVIVSGGNATEKGDTSIGRTAQSSGPVAEEETTHSVEVFPNPVTDRLVRISYSSPTAQSAQINVRGLTSPAEKRIMVTLHPGLNKIEVNMDDMDTGLYVLTIITSEGKRFVTKIVVAE